VARREEFFMSVSVRCVSRAVCSASKIDSTDPTSRLVRARARGGARESAPRRGSFGDAAALPRDDGAAE
jgi:hypothetical protein